MKYTKREFEKLLKDKLMSECNVTLDTASADQIYRCLAMITRQIMSDRQKQFQSKVLGEGKKQVYYLCMEFLMGRSLRTSLFNLGLNEVAESVLADADVKIDTIYEQEPDAGLGNGGLGRLAACYLDGMATDCIPGTGYSILYEYGIFKQKIVDGWQQETADNWLPGGQVWIKSHPDQAQEIRFDGQAIETWEGGFHHVKYENYNSVIAVPNDMYVAGYGSNGVSKLRLWQAKAPSFDMSSFNAGNYNTAISHSASAELISKILYPNDNHTEGKILRLRQQYFFSAASIADILQNHLNQYGTLDNLADKVAIQLNDTHPTVAIDILQNHLNQYGTLDNLADKVAIQLNDTHPTVAIPEMMRILLDECSYEWDAAFDICRKVFAYTNHTVMSEALEKWNADIFRYTLPRIWQIVCEMDRRCRADLAKAFPGDQGKIDYMAIIGDNQVRTANICAYTCHAINGVSKLHSEIIKDSVFHDYFLYKPQAFKNVTNGIAYRRWLLASNPGLTSLLEETIGDGFKTDAAELKKLEKFVDDKTVQAAAAKVKRENKVLFANYLQKSTGQVIDPDSIFDCQVKRMHEYKRQHLNALNIAAEYLYLKNNPNAEFTPKTYIFGAKAAPGYYMAKQMIRMICKLGKMIDEDPAVRGKLRIVYLEDYCVSLSERLMPASEVSEQISLAGTEASGTGNMKFMLNGAITLGTLDGANVEIADAAGHENEIIFGMLTPEVNALKGMGYHPNAFISGDNTAMAVLDFLEKGWNGENFSEVTSNLRNSDPYMVMADFKDYRRAQHDLQELYRDKQKWNHMSLMNISNAGIFSADRSIMDYARDIWGATPVK